MNQSLQGKFGLVVREHRLRLGVSQEEFAHRAGLHRTYVSLLERGQRNPSLNVMAALAKALKMPLAELVHDLDLSKSR